MKYYFEIKTGDKTFAGTDTDIFIVLYGEKGISTELKLNDYVLTENPFERNSLEEFSVEIDDIGQIFKIDLRKDFQSLDSMWYLTSIHIKRKSALANPSRFLFNDWIEHKSLHTQYVKEWPQSIFNYQTRETKYVTYSIKVPAHSKHVYQKLLTKSSGFHYKNAITKESNLDFDHLMTSDASYLDLVHAADELPTIKVPEEFLEFEYRRAFNGAAFESCVQTEDKNLSVHVLQEIENKTDSEEVYKIIFKVKKFDVVAKMNEITTIFTVDSELNFCGFELVK